MDAIIDLKQRMLFLERAHASAQMGHFVLDPSRRTIEFSSWVRENIGYNDMPIPLDRLPEIVPEEDREQFRQTVEEIVANESDFAFEVDIITAKGTVRSQRVSGIPAFENEHRKEGLIGYFGILQEVTKEKIAESELRAARDAAQAQLAARTNILATVSHEIRTPLGGILGIIDHLKRENSASERARALALIEDSCDALLDTLDGILKQASAELEPDSLGSKRFSPTALTYRVAELFRPLARRKGITIEVDAPSQQEARGDPGRIQQVLANFVSNAVKFTQAGSVTLALKEPDNTTDEWTFVVSDTGIGMDAKRAEEIFQPFNTTKDDTLGRTVGTGLGLSITRKLVEGMKGRIEVSSETGKGSEFTILLPLGCVDELEEAAAAGGGKAVILIDRATDAIQAEAVFSQFGYKITTLEDLAIAQPSEPIPLAVIADAPKLSEVPADLAQNCSHIIGLTNDRELSGREQDPSSNVSLIASDDLTRSLKALLSA